MTTHSLPTSSAPNASPSRWWDAFAAVLLVATLLTAATRLEATRWTANLDEVQLCTILGAILGLALGKSRFRPREVGILAFSYGAILIPWRLGLLMGETLTWEERFGQLGVRVGAILVEVLTRKPITDSLLFLIMMCILFWALSLHAGYIVVRRAYSWQAILPTGLVLFIIHYYANCPYSRSLNACIDPGLQKGAWYLAVFLLFSLLMVGRLTYLHRFHHWNENRTYIAPEVGFDLMRVMVTLAILMVVLAWVAPSVQAAPLPAAERVYNAVGRPLEVLNDWFSPLFSAIRVTIGIVSDSYGDDLTMGLGTTLSDTPVLQIKAPTVSGIGAPYYWRARVYDHYEEGAWDSTYPDSLSMQPDQFPTERLKNPNRVPVTVAFTPYETISMLYTVSQPVWLGQPVQIELAQSERGVLDMAAFRALQPVRAGQSYDVQADLAVVSMSTLRAAGKDYPDWVLERYLQLPDNISPRTRELARRIAEGKETPYDVAEAVTLFLRANIDYVEMIDPRPAGQEPLDWFLFDYRKGFCQYYASAEIILLRSLGIPARLAVGYAQGELQPDENAPAPSGDGTQVEASAPLNTYLVRQKDAHAWPEVYFPGIGWVEFEPTVSQTAINRPQGERSSDPPRPEDLYEEQPDAQRDPNALRRHDLLDELAPEQNTPAAAGNTSETPSSFGTPLERWGALAGISLLLASVFVWRQTLLVQLIRLLQRYQLKPPEFLQRWANAASSSQPLIVGLERGLRRLGLHTPAFLQRWAYYASLSPLMQAYLEINRALRRLGSPPEVDATPAERTAALAEALPEAASYARMLLNEYQVAMYGAAAHKASNTPQVRHAAGEIRKQSYLAILRRWMATFRRLAAEQHIGE